MLLEIPPIALMAPALTSPHGALDVAPGAAKVAGDAQMLDA